MERIRAYPYRWEATFLFVLPAIVTIYRLIYPEGPAEPVAASIPLLLIFFMVTYILIRKENKPLLSAVWEFAILHGIVTLILNIEREL